MEVVQDAAAYPEWNRFCRRCEVEGDRLLMGSKFKFDVHLSLDELPGDEPLGKGMMTTLEVSMLGTFGQGGEDDLGPRCPGLNPENKRRGRVVAWRNVTGRPVPDVALRSERVQAFYQNQEDPSGTTDYICWETFYGFMAPLIKLVVGKKLETGFGVWMEDLKARAEALERADKE
jgi:hypothetical protein